MSMCKKKQLDHQMEDDIDIHDIQENIQIMNEGFARKKMSTSDADKSGSK